MSDIVSFGEWVQARRNQLRYSRNALAQLIGCSPVTIKKIERDERRPSEQIAELLAEHLQIPEPEQEDFIRRARGEFVPRFGSPEEMSLAEAQAPTAEEDAPKHNLPSQTTPFFGREAELAEIATHLADPNCRLLTILGVGGMGKTRLGVEVAQAQLENFTDGVTYVALAPISASENSINPLAGAMADALKISFHGKDIPEQQLFDYLRRKEMLLVFDNFEHLLDTTIFVSELLRHAPDIKILITSRERLNLQEEWLFALQGLSFPVESAPVLDVHPASAVQLFSQRATQVNPSFNLENEAVAVLRICHLVEGMPLGLELAAAWNRQLSCQEIAKEIEAEIDFLATEMRNVPQRQRSIRAIFGSAWEKLSRKEQSVLQKLSVFRGGFERNAAKAIAGASLRTLSSLVDQSLLSMAENSRYHLHELLRQFAAEKLAQSPSEENDTRHQHSHHFLTFVTEQYLQIQGPEGLAALTAIEQDIDNIRVAIRWGVSHQSQLFDWAFGITLWQFYDLKGWFLEGEATFGLIATMLRPHCNESHPISQNCLRWAQFNLLVGAIQWRLGRLQQADETLQQSLRLLSESVPAARGFCLILLGAVATYKGEYERAQTFCEEGGTLLRSTGHDWFYGICLLVHDQVAQLAGDYEKAQRLVEECEPIFRGMGEQIYTTYVLSDLGRLAAYRGELSQAKAYLQASLSKRQALNYSTGAALILNHLGNVARLQGDFDEARHYFQQAIKIATEINVLEIAGLGYLGLGNLAVAKGDFKAAIRYFQECGFRDPEVGGPGWAALGLGNLSQARSYFQAKLQMMVKHDAKPAGLDALVGIAYLQAQAGQLERALELLALVQHHPASNYELKKKAGKLWDELAAEVSPEVVAEAEARGRLLDLGETAEGLLAEGDDT